MRIAVISTCSGAGKTTLSRRLAELYGIPHVELDGLFHDPGWVAAPDFEIRVAAALSAPDWVADGNYSGHLGDSVLTMADEVVWLDLPLLTCLLRLIRRTARRLLWREELWNGNRESLRNVLLDRDGLFAYAIRNFGRRRREFPARLGPHRSIRLRSQRDVDAWLANRSRIGPGVQAV